MIINDNERYNETFIKVLENYRQQLFDEGKIAYKNGQQKDCISIGNEYIINNEKVLEQYNNIMELIEIYLDFSTINKDEIYDIPQVTLAYKDKITFNLRIRKEKAHSFAKNARKYEKIFSNTLHINFPQQVYQLLYLNRNIPGFDFPAPEIKLLSEDIYDYEYRLESYYKNHNFKKASSQDKIWRSPYPHENINYKDFPDVINEYFQSEYFLYANNFFRNEETNLNESENDEKEIYNISSIKTIEELILSEDNDLLISQLYNLATDKKALSAKKYQLISKIVAKAKIYIPKNGDLKKALEKYINLDEFYNYFFKSNKNSLKYDSLSNNPNNEFSLNFVNETKDLKKFEEEKRKIEQKLSQMIIGTTEYNSILKELDKINKKINVETKKLQSLYDNLNNSSLGGV